MQTRNTITGQIKFDTLKEEKRRRHSSTCTDRWGERFRWIYFSFQSTWFNWILDIIHSGICHSASIRSRGYSWRIWIVIWKKITFYYIDQIVLWRLNSASLNPELVRPQPATPWSNKNDEPLNLSLGGFYKSMKHDSCIIMQKHIHILSLVLHDTYQEW